MKAVFYFANTQYFLRAMNSSQKTFLRVQKGLYIYIYIFIAMTLT